MTAIESPPIQPLLPPAPPVMVPSAPIAHDMQCIRCHYNLRTRMPEDLCPECGTPVAHSVEHYREHAKAIVLPAQLAGAAYVLAAAMLGAVICFVGVYGMKLYADNNGSPVAVLERIRTFNYLSHLLFVISTVTAAFLVGGAVGKKVLADGVRPVLSIVLVGYALISAVTMMLVYSLPRAGAAARFRGFRGPAFAILQSIKMGDFVGACMYLVLVMVGYGVMRNVAKAVAAAGLRRATQVAFALQVMDAALGVGVYGWMLTWSPRAVTTEHDGFILAADIFSMVISVIFGAYWLRVARTVGGRRAVAEEMGMRSGMAQELPSPAEKVSQFLAHQAMSRELNG